LLNFCLLGKGNKNIHKLCNDFEFWRNRLIERYHPTLDWIHKQNRKDMKDWKRIYLKFTYYLNTVREENTTWNDIDFMGWVLYYASRDGDFGVIDFLISIGVNNWARGLQGAIETDNQYLIDFYHENNNFSKHDYNDLLHVAAKVGNKELVNYYVENGADNYMWAVSAAFENNDFDIC
jgi:hypothetical protein